MVVTREIIHLNLLMDPLKDYVQINQDINNDGVCDVGPPYMFGSIAYDEPICGTLSGDDRDWYKFTVEAGSPEVVATLSVAVDSFFFPSLKLVSGVNDCSTFDEEEEGDIIDFDFVEDGNGNYTVSAQELDAGEYALIVGGESSVTKCGKSPYFLELKLSA